MLKLDFFARDPADRGGVRVAVKDLSDTGRADLVTAGGVGSRVAAYDGRTRAELAGFDALPGFAGGVFVG